MKLCERNFRIKTIIFINHKNNLALVKKKSSYLEFKLGKNVSKKKRRKE